MSVINVSHLRLFLAFFFPFPFFFWIMMCVIGLHCNIRGQVLSGVGVSALLPTRKTLEQIQFDRAAVHAAEEGEDFYYVRSPTHPGALQTANEQTLHLL